MAVGGACLAACCDDVGSSVPTSSTDGSSQQLVPGCEPCLGGLISRFYLIEISGMAVGQKPECESACESLDGAYVVEITSAGATGCFGGLVLDGVCTDTHGSACFRQMLLSFAPPTETNGVIVRVTIGPRGDDTGAGECATVTTIGWEAELTAPDQKLECLTLDRVELPFRSQAGSFRYCDGSAATVYVTAL